MGNLSTNQSILIEIDNQFKLQQPFNDLPGLVGPDSKGFYYHQQDETKIHSNSQNSIKIKFKYSAIGHNKYDSSRNYRYKWVYQVNDKTCTWHDIHKSLSYNEEKKMNTVTLPQKFEIIRAYLSKKDPIPPCYLHRSKMVQEMLKSVSRSSLYNEQNLKCVIATKKIKNANKERTLHPALLIWDRSKGFGKYDDTGAMMIYLSKTKGGQKKYKIQMKCEPTTPYDLKRYKWKYSQGDQENLELEHGLIDIVHWCLKYEMDNNYQHMRNCIQFMADLCDTFKIKYDSTHWANSVRIIKRIKNDSRYCSSDTNIMKELTEIIDEQVAKMSFDTPDSFTEFKQQLDTTQSDKYVTYPSINGNTEVEKLLETAPERTVNNTQTKCNSDCDEKHEKEEQKHWENEFDEEEMKEEYKQKLVTPIRAHCVECIMNRDLVNQQSQLLDTFQDLLDSKQICYDDIGLNNGHISCYDAPELAIQKKEIQIPRKLTDKVIPNKVNGWNNKSKYIGKKKIGPSHLFNYMHKSMLLNGSYVGNEKIKVINFDFYDKDTGQCLYCIMEIQGSNAKNYKWKLHNKLYNTSECKTFMNILPRSPRHNKIFQIQLQQVSNALKQWNISKKFNKIKWNKVNSYYRQSGDERTTLSLKNEKFKRYFSAFVRNGDDINMFPILMFNNYSKYWIEYVFIVEIKGSNIGISYGYNAKKGIIEVTGIHLDKNSLYVQHKLALPNHECHCLDNFISNYTDIKIGEFNEEKDKIKQLKTQLKQYKLLYKELYDQQQTNARLSLNSVSSASLLMSNVNMPHLYPQTVNTTYDLQVPLYPSISNYGLNNNYNIPLSYSNSITTSISQYALNGYYNGQIDPSVTNTIINNVVGPRSYSVSNNQLVENQAYK